MGETRPYAPSALAEGVGISSQAQSEVSRGRKNGPATWPHREQPEGAWVWRPRGAPGFPQVAVSPCPADLGPLEKGVQTAAFKLVPTPTPRRRRWKFS